MDTSLSRFWDLSFRKGFVSVFCVFCRRAGNGFGKWVVGGLRDCAGDFVERGVGKMKSGWPGHPFVPRQQVGPAVEWVGT